MALTVIMLSEQLDQCYLLRVMAEELTNARAALQRQTREAQGAIQDLLSEREEFSRDMVLTHRYHTHRGLTPDPLLLDEV